MRCRGEVNGAMWCACACGSPEKADKAAKVTRSDEGEKTAGSEEDLIKDADGGTEGADDDVRRP